MPAPVEPVRPGRVRLVAGLELVGPEEVEFAGWALLYLVGFAVSVIANAGVMAMLRGT